MTLLAATLAAAQDKPAAAKPPLKQIGGLRFVDTSEITIVNVEVSVRDKSGPVFGLSKDDFEVYQDGKLQTLTNFYFFTSKREKPDQPAAPPASPAPTPTLPAGTPIEPPPPREPRFIALYLDNENMMPFNRNRILNEVIEFVEQRLRPPDQAMVVSYQRSLKILQPFTSDPDEVASALRRTKRFVGARNEMLSNRRQIEDYISQNAENPASIGRALDQVESFAKEQRNNLTFTVRAIQELVTMMSGLPGRKSILYISDGLPLSPGLELFYELQDRYRSPMITTRAREYDSTDLFRGLVTSAAASGVRLYTIDARGLESDLGIEAENRQARSALAAGVATSNYQDSLLYMADQTGGLAVINANNVGPGLERIGDDIETYYSLGYRLIPTGEDRVHRIDVRLKRKLGYKLNFQRSFIEKSLPTRVADRVVSGLAFDIADNPLEIEVSTGEPAPAAAERWTLPVEVRVPMDKIALIPDGEDLIGWLMVYYAARDSEGMQSDLQRIEHGIRIPAAGYDEKKKQHWTISASLLLEPGTYRISVGVRDQLTNQAGYTVVRKPVHPELRR
ncbi:MAG TPA: VWA domain-containing protein [Thermoanaerobaculaceae bacterium]|nr:VWA domain-containing protein [Thermoanaerobaculaceae bacterium]HRS17192.1 VWA domain-containing protein [Thermoanaerobaculaceae bacterium]